jgi:hypothetical protein
LAVHLGSLCLDDEAVCFLVDLELHGLDEGQDRGEVGRDVGHLEDVAVVALALGLEVAVNLGLAPLVLLGQIGIVVAIWELEVFVEGARDPGLDLIVFFVLHLAV